MKQPFVSKVDKLKLSKVVNSFKSSNRVAKPINTPLKRIFSSHFYMIFITADRGKSWYAEVLTEVPERYKEVYNPLPDNFTKPELLESYYNLAPEGINEDSKRTI